LIFIFSLQEFFEAAYIIASKKIEKFSIHGENACIFTEITNWRLNKHNIKYIFTLVAILNVIISYIMQNFEYYPYITAGRNMPNMLKF